MRLPPRGLAPENTGPPRASLAALTTATVLAIALVAGCAQGTGVTVRKMAANPLADTLELADPRGPQPSDRTLLVLRRYDLAADLPGDPRVLLSKLQQETSQEPTPEKLYATAEVAYLGGKVFEPHDRATALDLYAASVASAYLYLFDRRCGYARNPYDPQFRGACDLYNGALESSLRLMRAAGGLQPGRTLEVETKTQTLRLSVVSRGSQWHDCDFGKFEFVSDYQLQGLRNQYRTYGLGVPLIVTRQSHPEESSVESHYPANLAFPVTAFVRVTGEQAAPGPQGKLHREAHLELYDPLTSTDILVGGHRVPLESDLTTPLAYFLGEAQFDQLGKLGLLDPERGQKGRGLYMIQPFDPQKIPVLMVHGLASSPMTWMEMFNDLRSERMIRDHFQFWFYLYPSGQPFWQSAAQLREDLAALRQEVDPQGQLRSLDQTVLVGHSMGGLVSKMQVLESGDRIWREISDQPVTALDAAPEQLAPLEETFFLRPNPSVRRVVTIGTPHRGSRYANGFTRYLGHKLIKAPMQLVERDAIVRKNSDRIRDPRLLEIRTSIDSLDPECPIFPLLLESPRPSGVRLHNIVGLVEDSDLITRLSGEGDGVVERASAELDSADSQIVVPADHVSVHRHPRAVLEVRRILLEHLYELHGGRAPPAPAYLRTAAAQGYCPVEAVVAPSPVQEQAARPAAAERH